MSRTHPFDPIRPQATMGRLTSGLAAGLVGGLLFGVMLLSSAVAAEPDLEGRGLGANVARLIGSTNPGLIWAVHSVMSGVFGLVFSLFIVPNSFRSNILFGLLYGAALWAVGYLFVLRTLLGLPPAFDAAAAYTLIGHLLFGLGLGATYVAFHNLEIREALDAQSEKWRVWGRNEREDTDS